MITEYRLLAGGDFETLERHVNEGISRGWQPIGGVMFAVDPNTHNPNHVSKGYFQAMVKYDNKPQQSQ